MDCLRTLSLWILMSETLHTTAHPVLNLIRELDQRVSESARRPNLPIEQNKREALVLTVQTGQAAKYRSAQQTVSKPSSHN